MRKEISFAWYSPNVYYNDFVSAEVVTRGLRSTLVKPTLDNAADEAY